MPKYRGLLQPEASVADTRAPWGTQDENGLDADRAVVVKSLGDLRLTVGAQLGQVRGDVHALCWVVEFPLLEWSAEAGRWTAMHHPFTSAMDEDWALLESDPGRVRAKAYDLVMDGWEVGGGSIRIHRRDRQQRKVAQQAPIVVRKGKRGFAKKQHGREQPEKDTTQDGNARLRTTARAFFRQSERLLCASRRGGNAPAASAIR